MKDKLEEKSMFSKYKYKRPDFEMYKNTILKLITEMEIAKDFKEIESKLKIIEKLRSNYDTMFNLSYIRHTINTKDEFYDKEQEYFDTNGPLYSEVDDKFFRFINNSKFKNEFINRYGNQFIKLIDLKLKSFSPEIIEDLKEENRLVTEYGKLIASAKIIYNGEELNVSSIGKYTEDLDRTIRKESSEKLWGFFEENEDKFDEIYDSLVKVRTKIAKKLGYKNFIELGYIRMSRTDYNKEMVEVFRKQVEKYVVPVAIKSFKKQQERLNLNNFTYYDLPIKFLSGNAVPKGDKNWMLDKASKMYSELSNETKEFFDFMINNQLLDLESKKNKAAGGYCTYIADYKSPFIFANFNGTSGDVDVLTHEAGHAFQVYSSRWIDIPEILWPTSESAEIHSMSMEFLTWPWMELFFKNDTEKYKFTHLESALTFIPYGVAVDEFQHYVYENYTATKEERKAAWRKIENKYLPYKDYSENSFLNKGTYWFKQGHIFEVPFYYIDYTLAQICALQFWEKMNENKEESWKDYISLCKEGGTKSFLELVKIANLKSPFKEGCMEEIIDNIDKYLDSIEDKKL
ncbi:M3 family oligoendopeptidase [Clostridium septicum]|uniref:M3 family oligoendopeptidase n=2 Tax=Clostridium septicum TaxID=1504 RepID=A0ABY5AWU7_CLOSE|nr:M3 family oligoendopeptidase [Clostridium septicum]MDU1313402.1 M3 family oligoendopeptidase [Clostridium septicum]UEC19474.1 M3 family oligoendopeptidase [Clostridium septicum]USR99573.1 M3 family oligoendopeptidase [Clostridium septicum]WLF68085.1 M3 family oligoendopeptidase [Clostridium septicum]